MMGVEVDFIVNDSLKALELYERIFAVERIEVSQLPQGENEVVFGISGTRFHMLDANPEFGMRAPDPEHPNTVWFNVQVPAIVETHAKALAAGCREIQSVTELPEYGVSNAMFTDPFGYVWQLHQIHHQVSHEERIKLWEDKKGV